MGGGNSKYEPGPDDAQLFLVNFNAPVTEDMKTAAAEAAKATSVGPYLRIPADGFDNAFVIAAGTAEAGGAAGAPDALEALAFVDKVEPYSHERKSKNLDIDGNTAFFVKLAYHIEAEDAAAALAARRPEDGVAMETAGSSKLVVDVSGLGEGSDEAEEYMHWLIHQPEVFFVEAKPVYQVRPGAGTSLGALRNNGGGGGATH